MRIIIEFFLQQKHLNHLLFVCLLLFSFFSYEKVAKEMFPPTTLDNIVITGSYRSASAEILDQLIVRDCEKILQENPNLSTISSVISKGSYSISAELISGSKSLIVNDVTSAISSLDNNLPKDMKLPTVSTVERFFPLISLAIFPKEDNRSDIVEISKKLKDEIGTLQHIYKSELIGKFDKSLRVVLDYDKIEAYGLNKSKVVEALEGLYLMYPIGVIKGKEEKFFVSTKSSNISEDEILNSYLSVDGKSLYLKEIATTQIKYEKHSLLTRTDGQNSLMIMTKKAKQGDAIKLSKEIRKILKIYKGNHPHLEFKVLNDSSFWIETRLNVISANILIGLILLFFAIWVFISLNIALVVIIGIPVSFAFGIIGIESTASSLNTLSMIGVLLSLGLLVDEAIVVSENIHRHKLMGKTTHNACVDGTAEVIPVLFVAMFTTVIAFCPLTTLTGALGAFIKIIPIMVIILIVSSFIESFVFLPSHYAILNTKEKTKKVGFRDKVWEKIAKAYKRFLSFLLRFKYIVLIAFVLLTLALSSILVKQSTFILFPEFDAMSINVTGKVKGNSLALTSQESRALEEELILATKSENVSSIHSTIGMKSDGRSQHEMGNNLFTITIYLKPKISDDYFNRVINPIFHIFGKSIEERRTRTQTAKEIEESLKEIFKKYESKANIIKISSEIPQTGVVNADIALQISAQDNQKTKEAIAQLEKQMRKIDGVYNIKNDMDYNDIDLVLDLNSYGKSLGFTQTMLIIELEKYLALNEVSRVTNQEELIRFKIKIADKNSIENLENFKLSVIDTQQIVKLKDIAFMQMSRQISTIRKENREKVFTLTASLEKSKITSKPFYKKIKSTLSKLEKDGLKVYIKGEAGKNKQIQQDMIKSLLFTLFAILLILTWFFNSFWLSLFSLSVIPLSVLGVLLGHKLLGLPLTFSTLLGFVGLIGIVMNDTLMMLSFIKNAKTKEELIESASYRIRPILLTSITTILGLTTLIFFASGESLLMQPLAVSIGFGLLWATVINLVFVPVGIGRNIDLPH